MGARNTRNQAKQAVVDARLHRLAGSGSYTRTLLHGCLRQFFGPFGASRTHNGQLMLRLAREDKFFPT